MLVNEKDELVELSKKTKEFRSPVTLEQQSWTIIKNGCNSTTKYEFSYRNKQKTKDIKNRKYLKENRS